jgi:hypothetical protein
MGSSKLTAKVKEQILVVRDTGKVNMFDVAGVIEIARELDLSELFFILLRDRENLDAYYDFILYGDKHKE